MQWSRICRCSVAGKLPVQVGKQSRLNYWLVQWVIRLVYLSLLIVPMSPAPSGLLSIFLSSFPRSSSVKTFAFAPCHAVQHLLRTQKVLGSIPTGSYFSALLTTTVGFSHKLDTNMFELWWEFVSPFQNLCPPLLLSRLIILAITKETNVWKYGMGTSHLLSAHIYISASINVCSHRFGATCVYRVILVLPVYHCMIWIIKYNIALNWKLSWNYVILSPTPFLVTVAKTPKLIISWNGRRP